MDRRTIRRDIDYFRYQLLAPVKFDCVRNGYYYTEPTYQLPFTQLIRMFAAQRVRSVEETDETFDRPVGFRAEDLMKGSFRATRGEGDYDVVLRFGSHATHAVGVAKGQISWLQWFRECALLCVGHCPRIPPNSFFLGLTLRQEARERRIISQCETFH